MFCYNTSLDSVDELQMIPETDRAYIAGLFDGEGSIYYQESKREEKETQRSKGLSICQCMAYQHGDNHDG